MHDSSYMGRLNWQQISAFICTGSDQPGTDERSDIIRAKEYELAYMNALHNYRQIILDNAEAYHDQKNEYDKWMLDEELSGIVSDTHSRLLALSHELGMKAGFKLAMDLFSKKTED